MLHGCVHAVARSLGAMLRRHTEAAAAGSEQVLC